MQLHQSLYDRQAQADSAVTPCIDAFALAKGLEKIANQIRSHTGAVIPHG
jgi:hypothetical protein